MDIDEDLSYLLECIAELKAEVDAAHARGFRDGVMQEQARAEAAEADVAEIRIANGRLEFEIERLSEKLHHAEAEVKRMSKINTLLVRIGAQKERETNDLQDKLKAAEMENANKPIDSTKLRGYLG